MIKKTILLALAFTLIAYRSMAIPFDAQLTKVLRPNSITVNAITTPGGESVQFSPDMTNFIAYARENTDEIQAYLSTNSMPKEIAITLGLMPEKWAIDALIQAIPTNDVLIDMTLVNDPIMSKYPQPLLTFDDSNSMLYYSCIHSLTYMTGEAIGRNRYGTIWSPDVKNQWELWWKVNRETFIFNYNRRSTSCARYPMGIKNYAGKPIKTN